MDAKLSGLLRKSIMSRLYVDSLPTSDVIIGLLSCASCVETSSTNCTVSIVISFSGLVAINYEATTLQKCN